MKRSVAFLASLASQDSWKHPLLLIVVETDGIRKVFDGQKLEAAHSMNELQELINSALPDPQ